MAVIIYILVLSFLIISFVLSIQGVMMIFEEKEEENKTMQAKKILVRLLTVLILVVLNFLLVILLNILDGREISIDVLSNIALTGAVAGSVFSLSFLLIDKLGITLTDFFKGKNHFKIVLPVCQYTVFSIALYFILKISIGFRFAGVLTTICYPCSDPIPFILTNCITFFLTHIALSKPLNKKKSRVSRYVWFYLVWYVTTGLLGGLLGSYYDMEAGWYPEGGLFYMKIIDDMLSGVFGYGLYVVIMSIPYNIIALIGSFFILKYNKILDKEQKNEIKK